MTIRAQILCSLGLMFLLCCVMCVASWTITVGQQSDGLVINLAGRQRMTPPVERPLAHRARALSKRPSATSRARAATVSGSAPSWFRMLRDRVRAVPMQIGRAHV